MLTENQVVEKMSDYLKSIGYEVLQCLNTNEKGIDIIAEKDGKKIYIEAKGETSSKENTNRSGKPFNKNQAGHHIAVAILASMKIMSKFDKKSQIAIALPDNKIHRDEINLIVPALKRASIEIYFVSESLVERVV